MKKTQFVLNVSYVSLSWCPMILSTGKKIVLEPTHIYNVYVCSKTIFSPVILSTLFTDSINNILSLNDIRQRRKTLIVFTYFFLKANTNAQKITDIYIILNNSTSK